MHIIKDDIDYTESFWTGTTFLYYKGIECIKNEEGNYEYQENGETKIIKKNGSLFKGITLIAEDKEIEVVPQISLFDKILSIIFFAFIFYSPYIGAICGAIFGIIRLVVSRNCKSVFAKILVTIFFGFLCFGVILLVGWIISRN